MDLYGKDFITNHEWSLAELQELLDLASKMKRDRYSDRWTSALAHKTFMMFFFNPSVRTRMSFEAAATELGGHAQFMTPSAGRFKTRKAGWRDHRGRSPGYGSLRVWHRHPHLGGQGALLWSRQ